MRQREKKTEQLQESKIFHDCTLCQFHHPIISLIISKKILIISQRCV